MSEYAVAAGFIQFDPKERDVNGQEVRDITIRAIGTQKRVYITVWSDHADVELSKGQFVVAEGKFQIRESEGDDGETREFFNLSASSLAVFEQAAKKERETVNKSDSKSKAKKKADDDIPF